MADNVVVYSRFTDLDIHLFQEGKHFKLYDKMGSHPETVDGDDGVYFAVWAPSAHVVSVIGDFNNWNKHSHVLHVRWDSSGIWEGFIPGLEAGTIYKYAIQADSGEILEKGDPYARQWEEPPKTGSVVWAGEHQWQDKNWAAKERPRRNSLQSPFSVYEVHLGSWRRNPLEGSRSLTYREHAIELVDYVQEMQFTHVEFLPIMEHPFFGSWGYQIHGYFAPTSRYGTPADFMYLIDQFHKANIGVILDWVPSHFPGDEHGLYRYDGSSLYEHEDPKLGYHPDWSSYIFNYGRNEVRSFLISNAMFWFERYHIDGLRVDAVASMLYLDYSRKEGQWIPNKFGGRENLEAVSLLKELNETIYSNFPHVQMIAEESTSWPGVSTPTSQGGLGFGMKWMMGWMNDTLEYFKRETFYRQYHHNEVSFSITYAFAENFLLPLSHDEVVHGKGALINRMPGDEWQKFADLRLLYGYMFTHPGSKLLFMGDEIAQTTEWQHDDSLQWHLLDYPLHKGIQQLVKDLNKLYRQEKGLHEMNYEANGFEWIDFTDNENSVLAYIRKCNNPALQIVVICNFTPVSRTGYTIGVPEGRNWQEILNTDDEIYGGSGHINARELTPKKEPLHNQPFSLEINLPPLGVCVLKQKQG
jgi:1,4-alpha-glucan branching enzyme